MGDLSDEELALLGGDDPGCECIFCRSGDEIRRHRAAQAADAERVREAETEARAERAVCSERIANLQAAIGCEIEKRDAALARVAELERLLAPLLSAQDLTSGLVASADRVRAVVREAAIDILSRHRVEKEHYPIAGDIAARAAAQLTAPPPGHVCPVPYGLGPEDVDLLDYLVGWCTASIGDVMVERQRFERAIAVLDNKILAAHRAPTPTIEPLPEVIACGMAGCVSSIKKHLLPAGWLLLDGTWRCPRCKVIATSGAS